MTSGEDISFGNRYGDRTQAIFDFVRQDGRPKTVTEVCEELDIPLSSVSVYLSRLVRARWVYRPRRGVYALSPEAPARFLIEDYETGQKSHGYER